jgi:hypothetical protein
MVQSGQPVTEPVPPNPTSLPTNSRTDGPAQPQDVTVPVYFLGDTTQGTRLFREFRRYQGVAGWSKLRIAVNGAILGDTTDPDYRTGFPKGTSAQVSLGTSTVTVDLRGDDDLTVRRPDAEVTLQAIVHTVDGVLQARIPVEFKIDGARADTVLGVDTGTAAGPRGCGRRAGAGLDRRPGQRVDGRLPVHGHGPGGDLRGQRPVGAQGRCARRTTGVHDGRRVLHGVAVLLRRHCAAGTYTLVVHDTDESGGGKVNRDTKEVTVR